MTKAYNISNFYGIMVDSNSIESYDPVSFEFSELIEFLRNKTIKTRRIQESEEGAPDLISFQEYGTHDYWWVILYVNKIQDPINDLIAGTVIAIPRLSDIDEFRNKRSSTITRGEAITLG